MSLTRFRYAVPLLIGATSLGCNDAGSGSATTSVGASASSGAVVTASASGAAPQIGAIGVAPCDSYVKRMRACIQKAPEEERAPRSKSLDEIEKTWVTQAATEDGKKRVEVACAAAVKGLDETADCK